VVLAVVVGYLQGPAKLGAVRLVNPDIAYQPSLAVLEPLEPEVPYLFGVSLRHGRALSAGFPWFCKAVCRGYWSYPWSTGPAF